VEEERIKSALELAMERISAMPELTPEEVAAQKEKEYGPIGTALAVKYMSGALAAGELPHELSRYASDRRPVIRRFLVSNLCREILADDTLEAAVKALKGMLQIAPEKGEFLATIEANISEIHSEFETAKEKRLHEFSALTYEKIRNLGISGSAVRPNMLESEEWKKELSRIRQTFEPRLENIRRKLIQEIAFL
jgi:hypothetical protein